MPVTSSELDVVIPTWNRRDLLLTCLRSLAQQEIAHQTYVVDNGSTDGTAEAVAREFPQVVVLALPANLGFGRAVNEGIAAGDAPLVVLLNNDTVAPPEFLQALIAPLQDDAGLASVAGVLVDADGTVDAAGVVVDKTLAGYSHLHGQPLGDLASADVPLGPCGGAAAYRRSALVELGGFDPEIFAYGEDVDLALRARAAGHRCAIAGEARVLHHGGATLGRRSEAQLAHSGWSRGYLLGRYRMSPIAVGLELGVACVDGVRLRRTAPVTTRVQGYRRGRSLPARPWEGAASLSVLDGLRRRARA